MSKRLFWLILALRNIIYFKTIQEKKSNGLGKNISRNIQAKHRIILCIKLFRFFISIIAQMRKEVMSNVNYKFNSFRLE